MVLLQGVTCVRFLRIAEWIKKNLQKNVLEIEYFYAIFPHSTNKSTFLGWNIILVKFKYKFKIFSKKNINQHFVLFWGNMKTFKRILFGNISHQNIFQNSDFLSKWLECVIMHQNTSKCMQNELCKCFVHKVIKEVVFLFITFK